MSEETILEGELVKAKHRVKMFDSIDALCSFLELVQPKHIVVETGFVIAENETKYKLIWSVEE